MSEDFKQDLKEVHERLSQSIKNVHRNLRIQVKQSGDEEGVWSEHCSNESGILSQYANAMHRLATDVWTRSPEGQSRIEWCVQVCQNYFINNDLLRIHDKDKRRIMHHLKLTRSDVDGDYENLSTVKSVVNAELIPEINTQISITDSQGITRCGNEAKDIECISSVIDSDISKIELPFQGSIHMLDVGSCYNPFKAYDDFASVAIDINPAVQDVYRCDFLNIEISQPLSSSSDINDYVTQLSNHVGNIDSCFNADSHNCLSQSLSSFVSETFHVVVFSLLLEYLPTNRQRVVCVQNAWKVLRPDGLLVIITPDSKRQHRNRRVAVDWRRDVEEIGFVRYRYEKLQHVHCMAFRKVVGRQGLGWPSSHCPLRIPQDDYQEL